MKCKWYATYKGVCNNGECPYHGDVCPTSRYPEVCRYVEEKEPKPELNAEELVTALRICAGRIVGDAHACASWNRAATATTT